MVNSADDFDTCRSRPWFGGSETTYALALPFALMSSNPISPRFHLTPPNGDERLVESEQSQALPRHRSSATPNPASTDKGSKWPWAAIPHPLVKRIPPEEETSYQRVAQYIRVHEPDPVQRLKALHDYVVERIVYDTTPLELRDRASQAPESVFSRKRGLCIGYAELLASMASLADLEVVVVVGNTRPADAAAHHAFSPHAWNAARVNGQWVLLDPTWDAGLIVNGQFNKRYRTDYFMTPPTIFGHSHFPDDPQWQLRAHPLSLDDFFHQPQLSPAFEALGLELVSPSRNIVTTDRRTLTIELDNPQKVDIAVFVRTQDQRDACKPNHHRTRFICRVDETTNPTIAFFGPKENEQLRRTDTVERRTWSRSLIGQIFVETSATPR